MYNKLTVMLKFCSSFLYDQAFFGGYPNEENFKELVENDFIYFIDLTTLRERQRLEFDYSLEIPKYNNLFYMNFSIIDNNIPCSQGLFLEFITFLSDIIRTKKKIYIHCKGGHGRSSLIVASLLCHLYLYSPQKAFGLTKNFHEKRVNLKDKYKGIQCPQLYSQRKFIIDTFKQKSIFSQKNLI